MPKVIKNHLTYYGCNESKQNFEGLFRNVGVTTTYVFFVKTAIDNQRLTQVTVFDHFSVTFALFAPWFTVARHLSWLPALGWCMVRSMSWLQCWQREGMHMRTDDWQQLVRTAMSTDSLVRGRPSWRRLMLRIARGEIECRVIGKPAPAVREVIRLVNSR